MKGLDERHISPELNEKLDNADKAYKLSMYAIIASMLVALAEALHVFAHMVAP